MATLNRNEEDLKTQVALLEKDMSQVTTFLEKLDAAIEKITDVSSSIKELLAVHDHKLSEQKQVNDEIFDIIKQLREENKEEHIQTKEEITKLVARIEKLEQLKYKILGAAFVVGLLVSFLTNHMPRFT